MQPDLVEQKVDDYRLLNYPDMLDSIIARSPTIVAGTAFKDEMKRFLPTDVYDRTLDKEKFEGFLISSITGLYKELRQKLYNRQSKPEFLL